MKKVGITPGPVKFNNMEPNDVKQFNPSNTGTTGQVLTKTNKGYNWQTPSSGGGSNVGFNFIDEQFYGFETPESYLIILGETKTFNALIDYSISLNDENGNSDIVSSTASVVFSLNDNDSYYYANASLSGSNLTNNSKYYVIINGTLMCTINQGEAVSFDIGIKGTAMFSKTPSPQASGALQNIRNVEVSVNGITICVNQ